MPSKYEFSDEQIEYIKENWGKESAHSMKKRFGCTVYVIVKLAESLGYEKPKSSSKKLWTKEEEEILRTHAFDKTAKEIAKMINRSTVAVETYANKHDIKLNRSWSKEEETYLDENWGYLTRETIAKYLNRTVDAVIVKSIRMKLGPPADRNAELIKVTELSILLNVPYDRIRKTWVKYGLKTKKIQVSKSKKVLAVKIEDLWEFLEQHQNHFDARYLEENIFGKEPLWLKEKRKQDYQIPPPPVYTLWTENQNLQAQKMFLQGKSYDEISAKVGHTAKAVKARLESLGFVEPLSPCFWRAEEINVLRENYENGNPKTYAEMANELGRTRKAVEYQASKFEYTRKRTRNTRIEKNVE